MPTIRTLDGGTRTETMHDSNSAHEPPAYDGPQAPMSLREIAEAFVKHEDANVAGYIRAFIAIAIEPANNTWKANQIHLLAREIIEFVEAQNEG